jgi:hypothetical protein
VPSSSGIEEGAYKEDKFVNKTDEIVMDALKT